jgi:multidrug efflux pump subunit AcrA (membrane-fusion protein)
MGFLSNEYNVLNRYRRFSSLRRVRTRKSYRGFYIFYWGFIGVGLIVFLLMPWTQTIPGEGRVIAYAPDERRQEISAPVEGRIGQWRVQEGDHIKRGQVIADLMDNDPEIIERIKLERDALQKRLDVARMAVETARSNVGRQEELVKKGLSAPLSLEQARLNYNRHLVEEANAVVDLARVDVRLSRQQAQFVTAPIDGTILKITAGQGGQLVRQGQVLAVLVPDTRSRAVEIWVRGNDMPLITVGRHVRLQFEGWPALQFSGWPSVAIGTFGGEVGFIDPADDGEGYFRIIVFPVADEPWPDPRFLRQGVRVKGWVLLDVVTVGFEIWRVFNGFPPSLRSFEPSDFIPEVRVEGKRPK